MDSTETNNSLSDLTNKDTKIKVKTEEYGSLFNHKAYIDYARVLNNGEILKPDKSSDFTSKEKWHDYIKNSMGNFDNNFYNDINKPIPYSYNSDYDNTALDINQIVEFTSKFPQLAIKYQDFAYCKQLGYFPNNRLIVLRRYRGGVGDNLFNLSGDNKPLSTLITWLNPNEESLIDITFNEEWTEHTDGIAETIKNSDDSPIIDTTKKDDKTPTSVESLMSSVKDMAIALIGDTLLSSNFKREDGTQYGDQSVAGNPNLIKTSMRRKTGGGGLDSNISFTLKFEYELRYINNIDPSVAMLDMISNCIRMGTSTESFRFNIPALKNSDIVRNLMQNDLNSAYDSFAKQIKNFNDTMVKCFTELISNIKQSIKSFDKNTAYNTIQKTTTFIISRYREALKAAISVDTGMPSGIWHVTIGSPLSPIVSCGDLIIKKSTLTLGNELGYNDFPNSFTVVYEIESSRERGAQELQRIFNAGRGRVYVYKNYKDNPDYYKYDDNAVIDLNDDEDVDDEN